MANRPPKAVLWKQRAAFERSQESRIGLAQEPFLTCLVLAGNPVASGDKVAYPGQTISLRYSAAQRLVAQGRVSIVP